MKPEKKPFVVEFKNRRRQSTQQKSIWDAIDLKTASNQVAAHEMAGVIDASAAEQPLDTGAPLNIPDLSA
ncbi:hypothetical protein V2V90_24555 (plasmid) [Agrobacterium leguminum]|uniref:hypothetical protein n=1 Tax=Agrobacterium leguminum TaxID=2792015 RepID=UPI0030CFEC0E